jgi:hypothetical protein
VPIDGWKTHLATLATPGAIVAAVFLIQDLNGWKTQPRGPNLATELRKGAIQSAQFIERPPAQVADCLEQADSIALPLVAAPPGGSVKFSLLNEARHIAIVLVAKEGGTLAVVSSPLPPSPSEQGVLSQCLTGRPIVPPHLRVT